MHLLNQACLSAPTVVNRHFHRWSWKSSAWSQLNAVMGSLETYVLVSRQYFYCLDLGRERILSWSWSLSRSQCCVLRVETKAVSNRVHLFIVSYRTCNVYIFNGTDKLWQPCCCFGIWASSVERYLLLVITSNLFVGKFIFITV